MKKIVSVVIVIIMLMFVQGCTNKNADNINSDETQPYWNDAPFAFTKGKGGYYFISNNNVKFFDEDTQDVYPVCSKAECTHTDSTCDAYLSDDYYTQSIWYYKDYLYLLKYNEKLGTVTLVKFTSDCKTREDLFVIANTNIKRNGEFGLVFHGDSVYVYDVIGLPSLKDDNSVTIRKAALDGSKNDVIFSYQNGSSIVSEVKDYDDQLMFTVKTLKQNGDKIDCTMSGIYAYEYDTQQISTILDEEISDYSMDKQNNILYYFQYKKGLYKKDLNSGQITSLFPCDDTNQYSQISFDGNYIYISNQRMQTIGVMCQPFIWVVDPSGTLINKIETDQTYFGDSKYLFGKNQKMEFTVIDKKNITYASSADWKTISSK